VDSGKVDRHSGLLIARVHKVIKERKVLQMFMKPLKVPPSEIAQFGAVILAFEALPPHAKPSVSTLDFQNKGLRRKQRITQRKMRLSHRILL
jgi:hypothetical protein